MIRLFWLLLSVNHHGSAYKVKSCWCLVHSAHLSHSPHLCQFSAADFRQLKVPAAGKAVSVLFHSASAVLIYDYLMFFLVLWSSPLERREVRAPYKSRQSWHSCVFFFFFLFKSLLNFSAIVVLSKEKPQTWMLGSEATSMLGQNASKLNI